MIRLPALALMLSLSLLTLAGCQKAEEEAAAPAALVAPTNGDDLAWKEYLGRIVGENMAGVVERPYAYYLPMNSDTVGPDDADGRSQYARQLEQVNNVVQRTVLPGNLLAFGSPDSAKMGDLIVAAFTGAKPDALKGSTVIFIGNAGDSERVKAAVEAAGATFKFIEAK